MDCFFPLVISVFLSKWCLTLHWLIFNNADCNSSSFFLFYHVVSAAFFFPSVPYQPQIPPTFSLQKSLLSAHFCRVRGEGGWSRGRQGFPPTERRVICSHVPNPSPAPQPSFTPPPRLLSLPFLPLWVFDLHIRHCLSDGGTWQRRQHGATCRWPACCHRTAAR